MNCSGGSINGEFLRDQLGHSVGGGMVVGYLSFPHPYVVAIGSLMSTFGAGIQSLCCESKYLGRFYTGHFSGAATTSVDCAGQCDSVSSILCGARQAR